MEKQHGVNWSEVARLAFEKKLSELGQQKRMKSLESVIERLRATKTDGLSDAQQSGVMAGKEWAKGLASVQELERLERVRTQLGNLDQLKTEDRNKNYDQSDWLAAQITGVTNLERYASGDFWGLSYGETERHTEMRHSTGFAWGFATGALEVWDKVKEDV